MFCFKIKLKILNVQKVSWLLIYLKTTEKPMMTKCRQLSKYKQKEPRYFQKFVEILKHVISNPSKPQRILLAPDKKEMKYTPAIRYSKS